MLKIQVNRNVKRKKKVIQNVDVIMSSQHGFKQKEAQLHKAWQSKLSSWETV